MKPVPPNVVASGPAGTVWFGGPVDRSMMALRVMAKVPGKPVDVGAVSRLFGADSHRAAPKIWSFVAPEEKDGDLDAQVEWILSRLTGDLSRWAKVNTHYRVDLFCGLFLERANRGTVLSPKTLSALGERGLQLSFDIYASDDTQNRVTAQTP